MSEDVYCPFCKQEGFDLIGLKNHLKYDCRQYRATLSFDEEERALSKINHKIKKEIENG
jgi:transposase-like protein